MIYNIVPHSFFQPSVWEDESEWDLTPSANGGISIAEDDQHVFVQASLPGVDPKDIEITFDKGVVWIKGEVQVDEKNGKKFYRKNNSQFSYRVAIPGEIDLNVEPKAESKHGVMTIAFSKLPQSQPKKITVKLN